MFKALTDLMDRFFKPVNVLFSKLIPATPPAQGGNVLGRTPEKDNWGKQAGRLVDRLPQFVIDGAPTPLEALRIPLLQVSTPTGAAAIARVDNEAEKPSWAEVREV